MADVQGPPWMGDGTLETAMSSISHRRAQINDALAAADGQPGAGGGGPQGGLRLTDDPRTALAQTLMAGSQSLGARGQSPVQMTPQQQAQLVQMLRARGMQRPPPPGQPGTPPPGQPGMPPQPGMPAPGGVPGQMPPLLQQAQPIPGMQ